MAKARIVATDLLKKLLLAGALYAGFRFLGDFSSPQSIVLAFVAWIGYGFYEELNASGRVANVFTPFRVSVQPNWYLLLFDFKLLYTKEEWYRLCDAAPEGHYAVFRSGFTFTVIRPPTDNGPLPGLTFWDNQKRFLAEVELSEPVIEIEDKFLKGEHPFFHHPGWASLPGFCFKSGTGGYEIGLEVQHDWWEQLCKSADAGELAKIKQDTTEAYRCGTTRLIIATLPYSEFGLYYVNYDRAMKILETADKQLEINGWKRKIEPDSEISDPWSHVEHKYFTVSHRSI